ncbi:nucleoside 2-deoxyribosyltransferase [Niveispirillum sp. SYP-B3756]|uniref:nucleoside 2-deoxyribosyltransferase n=1 Tax=Niveispirillum sp. SYP-B3756 TaxID=2662178 RepID=UPI001292AD4A|nr:nucleoside 2-deoxyribosyltransferase [Niveispirillum sp. SYP-B3756]MQP68620.1 nucleoside 2-deoxyribosyltransferase [Niveispirillum sp. SYP-B3756]
MSRPRLYLAGPDVFLPDPMAAAAAMKAICAELGLEGVFPIDAALAPAAGEPGTVFAARIRQANLDLIRGADGVIANCSPFRGPSVDDGTAYEMGYATALGKPVFPWAGDIRPLLQRTQARQYLAHDGWVWRDADQMEVEEFGLPVNLMLVDPATGPVAGSFERAAEAAANWFNRGL